MMGDEIKLPPASFPIHIIAHYFRRPIIQSIRAENMRGMKQDGSAAADIIAPSYHNMHSR